MSLNNPTNDGIALEIYETVQVGADKKIRLPDDIEAELFDDEVTVKWHYTKETGRIVISSEELDPQKYVSQLKPTKIYNKDNEGTESLIRPSREHYEQIQSRVEDAPKAHYVMTKEQAKKEPKSAYIMLPDDIDDIHKITIIKPRGTSGKNL